MSDILEQAKAINAEVDTDLLHKMDKKQDLIIYHIISQDNRISELETNKKWAIGAAWTSLLGVVGILIKMVMPSVK